MTSTSPVRIRVLAATVANQLAPDRAHELAQHGVMLKEGMDGHWRVLEVPAVLRHADTASWVGKTLQDPNASVEDIMLEAAAETPASTELVRRILQSKPAKHAAGRRTTTEALREAGSSPLDQAVALLKR